MRGGRGIEKPTYRGDCEKGGGLGKFVDLRGDSLARKWGGGVFEAGLIASCPLCWA